MVSDNEDEARPGNDARIAGTPLWVKVAGAVVVALIVLVLILQLAGVEHGPGRHAPPGSADLTWMSEQPMLRPHVAAHP